MVSGGRNQELRAELMRLPLGKFVKVVVKRFPETIGKRVLMATDYLTPNQLTAELANTFGVKVAAVQVSDESYKSFLPPPIAQEMLENMKVMDHEGYFGGESLEPSKAMLEDKVTTWKEHILEQSSIFA